MDFQRRPLTGRDLSHNRYVGSRAAGESIAHTITRQTTISKFRIALKKSSSQFWHLFAQYWAKLLHKYVSSFCKELHLAV